jgi:aspartokinase
VLTDAIVGHGEIWCACLFAARLRLDGHSARMLDATDVLIVEPTSDGQSVDVDYDASNANLDAWAQRNGIPDIIVCTGFIARNRHGQVRSASASELLAARPKSVPHHVKVQFCRFWDVAALTRVSFSA